MLWTGMIAAALLAGEGVAAQPSQGAAAPAPAPTVDRSQQVVCRNQAVTGSRFTHRRCQTRGQARIAQQEAQRFVGDSTRSGPSIEELVDPVQRSWNPQ